MTTTLSEYQWSRLLAASDAYRSEVSPHYDEVLHHVSEAIDRSGSISKADIGALILWKRLNASTTWATALMVMPDREVRDMTERAVTAVRDSSLAVPAAASAGRSALSPLPGARTGDALASALLTAAAPRRMAVYDRRAQAGLESLGLILTSASGRYGRYMELVERLRADADACGHSWTARDVDTARYWLGRRP